MPLPIATESCIEARASYDRCDENATPLEKYGVKEGACDISLTLHGRLLVLVLLVHDTTICKLTRLEPTLFCKMQERPIGQCSHNFFH